MGFFYSAATSANWSGKMSALLKNWKTTGLGICLIGVAAFRFISSGMLDSADMMAGLAALGLVSAADAAK